MRFSIFGSSIAVLILCSAGFAAERVPGISHEDLVKLVKEKKVVLIDCNGIASYKNGHIPGALNFNSADFAAKLPAQKDALIVAYCGNEHCPAYKEGVAAVVKLGYTNVKHYPPGIHGWRISGEKMETSD